MEASFLDEWRKVFQEASIGTNPLMAKLSQDPDIPQALKDAKSQLAALKAKNIVPKTVYEKFRDAHLESEYRAVYGHLCSESHNNVRSIHDRHVYMVDGKFHMAIRKENDPLNKLVLLDTMFPNLLNSTYNIHSF